jgi:hypothetical protein
MSGVRDPPPGPLPDGALRGAVGASSSGSPSSLDHPGQPALRRRQGPLHSEELVRDIFFLDALSGVAHPTDSPRELVEGRGDGRQFGEIGCHRAILAAIGASRRTYPADGLEVRQFGAVKT